MRLAYDYSLISGKIINMNNSNFPVGIGFMLFLSLILSGCGMQSIPTALNEVEAAWSEVINQYKRRSDLIPNLVNIVKGYASHEKETLQAVVEARAKATQTRVGSNQLTPESLSKFSQAQAGLGSALSRLMVVVERYPDLKDVLVEAREGALDLAESKLIKLIKEGNLTAIIFFLKTQGKHRGYVERQELEVATDFEFTINIGDSGHGKED